MTLGAIVIDEKVFPIVDLRLRGGGFVISAMVPGPTKGSSTLTYTVHDEEGGVVYRSSEAAPLVIPEVAEASRRVAITISLAIEGKEATRASVVSWTT